MNKLSLLLTSLALTLTSRTSTMELVKYNPGPQYINHNVLIGYLNSGQNPGWMGELYKQAVSYHATKNPEICQALESAMDTYASITLQQFKQQELLQHEQNELASKKLNESIQITSFVCMMEEAKKRALSLSDVAEHVKSMNIESVSDKPGEYNVFTYSEDPAGNKTSVYEHVVITFPELMTTKLSAGDKLSEKEKMLYQEYLRVLKESKQLSSKTHWQLRNAKKTGKIKQNRTTAKRPKSSHKKLNFTHIQ